METEVLFFGRLTEIVGAERLVLAEMPDTDTVRTQLELMYPALKPLQYKIAVSQQIIHDNTALSAGMTVALMPPFSGG